MSNIERNVAKLICGDEVGNAVLLNNNRAITVKHCIEPHIENREIPIRLYCYNGKEYIKKEATLLDYSTEVDGFAILEINCELEIEKAIALVYNTHPFEECSIFGFNKNHNEKPSWRKLMSNAGLDIKLDDLIYDISFAESSNEKSVNGLSGSPILLNNESNSIIGLVTQQKSAGGQVFEIHGISVKTQETLLKRNNIFLNKSDFQVPLDSQEINGVLVSSKSRYDYSWLQISDLQLFDDIEESEILEEFSKIK